LRKGAHTGGKDGEPEKSTLERVNSDAQRQNWQHKETFSRKTEKREIKDATHRADANWTKGKIGPESGRAVKKSSKQNWKKKVWGGEAKKLI